MAASHGRRHVGAGAGGRTSQAVVQRPLDGETLVWRKGFSGTWRRLVDALAPDERPGPPSADHGRWTATFAAIEANYGRFYWSWLGPLAYLWLGSWRKALMIVALVWIALP